MTYTPVTMDKVRNFKYGMKAINYIEKKFGKAVSKVDFEGLTMEQAATVICAGLIHEDPSLTPDKVMDIIDGKENFAEVMMKMEEAFSNSFGNGESGKN